MLPRRNAALSKEELETLKGLNRKDIADLPFMHSKEISYVFLELMPKLIQAAEDYSILVSELEELKKKPISIPQVVVQMEQDIITNLEMEIEHLKQFYNQKREEWIETTPDKTEVPVTIEVPKSSFWGRWFCR